METWAPATEKSDAFASDDPDVPYAPDTVRDAAGLGGTTPMARLDAHAHASASANTRPRANETARLPVIETAPLAEPVRVDTQPFAAPAPKRESLTYEVYSSDDTLLGAPALAGESPRSTRNARARWLGLAALGLIVAVGTALAVIGSSDESPTARVETTSATVSSPRASTTTTAAAVVTAEAPMPAITFVPPLGPLPKSSPQRAPVPRPVKR
jgi:hypothetical protein